jgi:hypothetical protein
VAFPLLVYQAIFSMSDAAVLERVSETTPRVAVRS